MSQRPKLTRAERRERRASTVVPGVYGVDAMDAGATSWTGRYLTWARTPDEAKERIKAAGFHKKQIQRHWTPSKPPPEGLPAGLASGCNGWYRSRLDDDGWTEWEALGATYRHPSQALAAVDPSVR
jgi:hypothetical protein